MSTTYELEGRLTRALERISSMWLALSRPGYSSGFGSGVKSSDEVTGQDRRVSLGHEIMLCLNGWARIVVEDRDVHHGVPSGSDVLGMCQFLSRHAQWFSGHEAAEDAVTELDEWAAKLRQATFPDRRDWMPFARCPLKVDDGAGGEADCDGMVRVYSDPERDPKCSHCQVEAVISWWRERLTKTMPETVTPLELVRWVHREFGRPYTVNSVRYWVSQKWIEPLEEQQKGRTMTFDTEATLFRLAKRWHAERESA